ncbi:conserved lipothrixviral structural protein [Sulfolobus islandicus filamentous virus 2]|uniref:Conserved lipothrixviral structural protein n=1 Tax=Sulfolobus islandicus filamentous virus 2 TaxID=1902331 RepID=A0A1D8BJ88_SIFV|nr:conserved lipothrixviral structural protein [Sulfolobus islandicus filamentous virus 2]
MNIGTAGHVNGAFVAGNPEIMRAIARLSEQETYNWVTDYAPSHLAKEVVKQISGKYNIPGAYQGLLMAFAEKVLANYILDYKGEPLVEIHHNFLWELMQRQSGAGLGVTSGFLYTFVRKDGKPVTVDMSKVLTEIEDALFKLVKK